MTVDLKWGLPLVLPFAFLALARAVFWFAGAEWNNPNDAAMGSWVLGVMLGAVAIFVLSMRGIKWPLTIRKPRGESE